MKTETFYKTYHLLRTWWVNVLECEEDDDKEGCMNMVTGVDEASNYEGWRTLDSSWRDLEEESDGKIFHIFHVNLTMKEVERNR